MKALIADHVRTMPLNECMPVILRDDQWPKWLGEVPAHEQEIKDMMHADQAGDVR